MKDRIAGLSARVPTRVKAEIERAAAERGVSQSEVDRRQSLVVAGSPG